MITHLGGHPSLGVGPLLETDNHGNGDILRESLAQFKCTKSPFWVSDVRQAALWEQAGNQIKGSLTHRCV